MLKAKRHHYYVIAVVIILGVLLLLMPRWLRHSYAVSTVKIDGTVIQVQEAQTTAQQQLGLSGRAALAPNEGMLFVYKSPQVLGFWMKEMRFPIDILWLTKRCRIIYVAANVPPCPANLAQCPVIQPEQQAQYVLEVPANFAAQHQVDVGNTVMQWRGCPKP